MKYLLATMALYLAIIIAVSMKYSFVVSGEWAWVEMLCAALPMAALKFIRELK